MSPVDPPGVSRAAKSFPPRAPMPPPGYQSLSQDSLQATVLPGFELTDALFDAPSANHCLKVDGSRLVYTHQDFVIKQRPLPNTVSLLLRGTRAERALRHASELTRRGFQTPLVHAAVRHFERGQSYLICAHARGRPLEQCLKQQVSWPRYAKTLAALHDSGSFHGDLKRANLWLDDLGQVQWLDLDAMRFDPLMPLPRAAKDLGMLLSSIGGALSAHQRARFFLSYARSRGLSPRQRLALQRRAETVALARFRRGSRPPTGGWPP